ncbi:hypothetical protein DFH08DRAFT_1085447 [Mycena albidolilacea]|uniref:Transmembrane protein n=1 Tax=Mycena albidolilacea TaxID=1033008 RepID=A0AAD6ZHX2_9AGAR|nr:hypothetical protein DFH08DRAFT_1085447 [Mycena albidolilacea]
MASSPHTTTTAGLGPTTGVIYCTTYGPDFYRSFGNFPGDKGYGAAEFRERFGGGVEGACDGGSEQARPGLARPTPQISQAELDRQQARPDQYQALPVLQRQRSCPDQPPYPAQPLLQRQPSRPDQPYQAQARPQVPDGQPSLQRQPSRPDQQQPYQDLRVRQPQPSCPTLASDIALSPPMADNYQYTPMQSVTPALMQASSAPSSSLSAASESQYSQSQYSLSAPIHPYADTMLIRGNSDDELDKTDVFWRHFNASAVQQQLPDAEKSSWLEKTQGKRSQHSRILWVVGIILCSYLAAGGIGIGVFLSFHNSSDATQPSTFGGPQDATSTGAKAATIGGGSGSAVVVAVD